MKIKNVLLSYMPNLLHLTCLFRAYSGLFPLRKKRAADRPRSLKEPFHEIYSGIIKVCLVFRENYKGYLWASWLEAPRVASFLKATLDGSHTWLSSWIVLELRRHQNGYIFFVRFCQSLMTLSMQLQPDMQPTASPTAYDKGSSKLCWNTAKTVSIVF